MTWQRMYLRALYTRVARHYRALWSLGEIEAHRSLQWVFGATVFSYFVAFSSWLNNNALTRDAVTAGDYMCWPYFQSCGDLHVLHMLPYGFSQNMLYMFLFATLVACVHFISKRAWGKAHLSLMPAYVWHTLGTFVLTQDFAGNYEYYLFIFATILLLFPHKEFFLKMSVILCYFLSTVSKIHPSWIFGTYFSSLTTGLPIFPDWTIPIMTNLIIGMEMVGAWFLLSNNHTLRRLVLGFFITFHLYSGLFVGYRYPATVLPTLVILFGTQYRLIRAPWDRRSIIGWTFVALLFFCQLSAHFLIAGDEKLTLEGTRYGLFMFDANHQCLSQITIIRKDGTKDVRGSSRDSARVRCEPYRVWFRLSHLCARNPGIARIEWSMAHSINGEPFYLIVNTKNVCALTYAPFRHNEWIKTEYDNPPIVGYPVKNVYQ